MTLAEYVKKQGSQEKAAASIGVTHATVWRWLHGRSKPRGLELARLQMMGVELGEKKIPDLETMPPQVIG